MGPADALDVDVLLEHLASYGFSYFSSHEALDLYRRSSFGRRYERFVRLQDALPADGAVDPSLSKRFDEFAFHDRNLVGAKSSWSDDTAQAMHAMTEAVGSGASRILDVGCSGGHIATWFAKLNPNRNVLGVDVSQPALAFARRRARAAGIVNVRFEMADIEISVPAETFDVVLESATFYVLRNVHAALLNIERCLSPNGRLISVPMLGRVQDIEAFLTDLGNAGLGVDQFDWVYSVDLGRTVARPIIVASREGRQGVDVTAELARAAEHIRSGSVAPLWPHDAA